MDQRFKLICKKPFTIKHLGDKIKVHTHNIEDYENLEKFLKSNKINYYTHALKIDKPRLAVLKGLPSDVTLEEIIDEVKSKLPSAFDCSRMNTTKTNDKYPYHIVKFSPETTFQAILRVSPSLQYESLLGKVQTQKQ
uniref:Pre-C2HC domain-containing protein n=1 Tax=Cacopsylla melanoneura TaxID=428564 RepID=A0A8D9FHR4_9HEMI